MSVAYINNIVQLQSLIANSHSKIILLTDTNVEKYCLPLFSEYELNFEIICVNAGERYKNSETLQFILGKLFNYGLSKHDLLINLGGGVISDIGGLAAALYKRGIEYINIPTTLMGMVDAAHGGKTAINFNEIKNSIGIFHKPSKTIVHVPFLNTLPLIELKNGMGEIIKYAIISGNELFNEVCKINELESLAKKPKLIEKCIRIKLDIVASDYYDTGVRRVLNLGHTIGHALEALYISINESHGFFVAQGIVLESIIAFEKGILSKHDLDKIIALVFKHFKKLKTVDLNAVWDKCLHDKKNSKEVVASLPMHIGKVSEGIEINKIEVESAIKYFYEIN